MRHPFVYGRPVRNKEFLGRKSDQRTIISRLLNGESTAIVGEPRIGKTSLLYQLVNPDILQEYLEDEAPLYWFNFIELQQISTSYGLADFWKDALEPVKKRPGSATISRNLKRAAEEEYTPRSLERLFYSIGSANRRLVLLLDEFDRLFSHSNFKTPEFFALLRSLSTRTGGLSLITATRMSLVEMNERGREILDTGSPFFNHMIAVELKPFEEASVEALLSRAGDSFTPAERQFARRVAGRLPFLLQAMAAAMLECDQEDRCSQAAELFYERVYPYFNDLWVAMDDPTRTTAVILSLMVLGGTALGQEFAYGEIERVQSIHLELRKLANRGLAEKVGDGWQFDWEHSLLWQGERWTVGPLAFTWWVRDAIISQVRDVPTYDEWLRNKRIRVLLTQEQWNMVSRAAQKTYEWSGPAISAAARLLLDRITGK